MAAAAQVNSPFACRIAILPVVQWFIVKPPLHATARTLSEVVILGFRAIAPSRPPPH